MTPLKGSTGPLGASSGNGSRKGSFHFIRQSLPLLSLDEAKAATAKTLKKDHCVKGSKECAKKA
jgi:hypothetical protein